MGTLRLLIVFLFGSFSLFADGPIDPAKFGAPVRVACVGDSITYGFGDSNGMSYPDQLRELLGAKWEIGNFGVSARTLLRKGDMPYWNEKRFIEAQNFRPDVVIIMLGTNDTKPHNWLHADEFAKDYTDLVNIFLGLPGKPTVFVCRPTPVPAPGNYEINEACLQEEIPIIDRIAAVLHLGVIDMHAALAGKPQLLPDRVHPNDDGALEMAKAAYHSLTGKESGAPTRLNSLFHEHAVLQRGVEMPVWGTAADGQPITVEFAGQKVSTVTRDGRWQVKLRPLSAIQTPSTLTVTGSGKLSVGDILVGDVWVAGGQSNMERQLGPRPPQPEILGWKEAVAAADLPLIRQFSVPEVLSPKAEIDTHGSWTIATPATAAKFSAIGFFFARSLQPSIGVPIGILHSAWGGTPAEAWVSGSTLKGLPDFRANVEALEAGAPPKNHNTPSVLYNAMIAPLTAYPVKGVLWYQGENNVKREKQYQTLLPALIADWRKSWGAPDLPFLIVQIAPFKDMSPEIREAQFLTVKHTPHTALIVTTDVGDATNIHPANKQPVGERLALAARALAYGEKLEYSGPVFESMRIADGRALLTFSHTGGGLVAKDGPPKGFVIAGPDKNFVPAKAEVRSGGVIVSSDQVKQPIAVRYGWENVPDVNLFNNAGLPASPFRTDAE